MVKLVHIVNPVKVGEGSDLLVAQPITFETMRRAKAQLEGEQVHLHAVCYEEDVSMIPEFFDSHSILDRSILDTGEFKRPRKLPFLGDILSSVPVDDHTHVIYTNVDIALMPWFYSQVIQRIEKGIDAMIINRRTISDQITRLEDIEQMYAQAGDIHPGLDCFVMSKEIIRSIYLDEICVGINFIGKALEINLRSLSTRFKLYKHDHMTFHLGDDRTWKNEALSDYEQHNKRAFQQVLDHFQAHAQGESKELVKDYLYKYFDWNEDGANPYLNKESTPVRPPMSERIKRSIGALMGKM